LYEGLDRSEDADVSSDVNTDVNTGLNSDARTDVRTAASTDDTARLIAVAKALSDPIRVRMLQMMAEGRSCCELPDPRSRNVPGKSEPQGICVCEFQEQVGLGQSKTSYHLRVLKEAGLIIEETRGKWSFYSLDRAAAGLALESVRRLLKA
jgi:ArsR family transcriptional regulator